jgi:hypothetical protein
MQIQNAALKKNSGLEPSVKAEDKTEDTAVLFV